MTMRIKGTNKVIGLDIIDTKTGLNWTHDFFGEAGAFKDGSIKYNADEEIWIINPDAFAWWLRYIEDYENDEAAIHELMEAIYTLYPDDMAEAIEDEFYNTLLEDDDADIFGLHHAIKQGALEWFSDCYLSDAAMAALPA